MAIIKHDRATDIFKAFVINSFITAFLATIVVEVRRDLDQSKSGVFQLVDDIVSTFDPNPLRTETRKMFYTFVTGFLVSLLLYNILYVLIGFGGGMTTTRRHHKYF